MRQGAALGPKVNGTGGPFRCRQGTGLHGVSLILPVVLLGALLAAKSCCVEHAGRIGPGEAELLSTVAWTLGCPPPSAARSAGQTAAGTA